MALIKKLPAALARKLGVAARAKTKPQNAVLSLVGAGSDLEAAFATLWKQFGRSPSQSEPLREYRFAEVIGRRWRFDFAWPAERVAVELEGIFQGWDGERTRHQRAAGYAADAEKYNHAVLLGWRVLRFTSADLRKKPVQTIELVNQVLAG